MPRTKPHGHKRKHLFNVGDLVRWNRWYTSDDWIKVDGRVHWKQNTRSHLGIVLRVYQSASKARCWSANVKFMETELNTDYWSGDWNGRSIPLGCLEVT
jgi:hypothetical protein